MSVYRRGKIYWYDFVFNGKRYAGSTKLRNEQKANLVESKLRTDLAMGEFDLVAPKTAPTLRKFLEGEFLDHIRLKSKGKPKTIKFYEQAVARLLEWDEWAAKRLNHIDEKLIVDFIQWRAKTKRRRHGEGIVSIRAVNAQLQGLRHALNLAGEWKYLVKPPKIRLLPGERKRDYVLTGEVENAYLAVCKSPLKEAAILMLDMGLRPEECVRIRKADIVDGRIYIREGKTPSAKRSLLIPARSAETIAFLSEFWKKSEWIFPGRRKGQHLTVWALEHFHNKIRTETVDPEGNPVFSDEFDLYCLRHTFGTRLGESCGNPYTVKELMGHGSIKVSERYVHVSRSHTEAAMRQKEALDLTVRNEKGPAILPQSTGKHP